MSGRLIIFFALIVFCFCFFSIQVQADEPLIPPPPEEKGRPDYMPGELIFKLRQGSTGFQLKPEAVSQGFSISKQAVPLNLIKNDTLPASFINLGKQYKNLKVEKIIKSNPATGVTASQVNDSSKPINRLYKLSVGQNVPVEGLVNELSQDPGIEYAEPNYIFSIDNTPNDPYYQDSYPNNTSHRDPKWNPSYDYQWNLKKINAQGAWDNAGSLEKIKVAVVDTGVDYTHPELGHTQLEERPLTKITSKPLDLYVGWAAEHDQTIVFDHNRLAYPSGDKIYIYSFSNAQTTPIELLGPQLRVARIGLYNNHLVYYAINLSDSKSALYYKDLNGSKHIKIAEVDMIGFIACSDGVVAYYRRSYQGESGFYFYNFASGQETNISVEADYGAYMPLISGDQIIYLEGQNGYEKAVIMNYKTGQKREINPPNLGPILDFDGDKIIYASLDSGNPDPAWSKYYIYNINTGDSQLLAYSQAQGASQSEAQTSSIGLNSYIISASMGDGVVFFDQDIYANYLIGYDQGSQRYVRINLLESVYDFDAEGKKVCFLSGDFHIYCHDYNPADDYPIPEQVFNNVVVDGWDFINNDFDPYDDNGHGTHIAGTITAATNNNKGIAGLAPNVEIIAIKIFNRDGTASWSIILEGINSAVSKGAKIINASFGGPGYLKSMEDLLSEIHEKNVLFVVAAGNSRSDVNLYYPASINCASSEKPYRDCTLTVSATDETDNLASYSNWGSAIDVSAPGGSTPYNLLATKSRSYLSDLYPYVVGDNYLRMAGTSMAAPHVVALAALIWGKNPQLTNDQVRNIILNSADDLGEPSFDLHHGYGRINANNSLSDMDISVPPVARLSVPTNYMWIGPKFKIKGSSFASSENFSHYKIDYLREGTSVWSDQGIKLANSGQEQVSNDLLGYADLGHLPNGKHTLRLTTYTADGKNTATTIKLDFDTRIRSGFPVEFGTNPIYYQPVIADLNKDKSKEIIFKNALEGEVHIVKSNGEFLSGWPQTTHECCSQIYVADVPLVSDINPNVPGLEIIQSISKTGWDQKLLAWHIDGSSVPGWSIDDWGNDSIGYTSHTLSSSLYRSEYFITQAETHSNLYITPTYLQVFDNKLTSLPGWPVELEKDAVWHAPTIADINRDNKPELLIKYNKDIRAYDITGKLLFTISLAEGEVSGKDFAVVDLDKDGYYEIVNTSYRSDWNTMQASDHRLNVWDHQGNTKSGPWPHYFDVQEESYSNDFLIGDFNHDGKIEILVSIWMGSYSKVFIVNNDAVVPAIFPKRIDQAIVPSFHRSNVGLKNNKHLFASRNNWADELMLFEYDPSSSELSTEGLGFSKDLYLSNAKLSYISLDDLDNDNKLEMIVSVLYNRSLKQSFLYVLDLNYEIGEQLDWPQYLHDPQHTNTYNYATKPSDFNKDYLVDKHDANQIFNFWGSAAYYQDLNADNKVNSLDQADLLRGWGSN